MEVAMRKVRGITKISLPRSRKGRCAIYEHEGKHYITNKVGNAYSPFVFKDKEYCEVRGVVFNGDEFWYAI